MLRKVKIWHHLSLIIELPQSVRKSLGWTFKLGLLANDQVHKETMEEEEIKKHLILPVLKVNMVYHTATNINEPGK